jgi:hypothetical protein
MLSRMRVIELRRYVMKPGRRDDLIDLFEREFLESQEQCGMLPLGHYRDLEDDNSFVWLRAFEGMESRKRALEAFYLESSAWRENRDAANDTMVDSDNVLLLRPARPGSGFDLNGLERPPLRANGGSAPASFLAASIVMMPAPVSEAYIAQFESQVLPRLRDVARRCAYLVTEEHPNTFPRLPVREGEYCFVAIGVCESLAALDAWRAAFPSGEFLRLTPALRSLLQ